MHISFHFTFSGTERYACCGEFVCHGSHVSHSSNVGQDVICNATRIVARNIHNERLNNMHATTCKVALHLNGLIITLHTMHTVYNLRHIITITFGFVFQYVYIENLMPSLLWVPDGLRELFDSPSVRIDTK